MIKEKYDQIKAVNPALEFKTPFPLSIPSEDTMDALTATIGAKAMATLMLSVIKGVPIVGADNQIDVNSTTPHGSLQTLYRFSKSASTPEELVMLAYKLGKFDQRYYPTPGDDELAKRARAATDDDVNTLLNKVTDMANREINH